MVGERLTSFLRAAGAGDADIERAAAEGWLPVLALDRMLMPGTPRYDVEGLAAAAEVDADTLHALWRALGFPDVPAGVALFGDLDLEAVRRFVGRTGTLPAGGPRAAVDLEHPERPARVFAAALARIAAYEAELLAAALDDLRGAGVDDEAVALALLDQFAWDDLAWLVDYAHRLQLRAAAWRRLAGSVGGNTPELGVGFVDLSGYTQLSEELDESGLASLLDRFEAMAFDTVAEHGGRVVKTIGDEIMFVAPPDAVASIAVTLLARSEEIDELPAVRIGVAFGPVLPRDGDYFGPVVNLASRITDRARPGTVLASEPLHDLLVADPRFVWKSLTPRRVRGIGVVKLYALRGGAA